MNFWQNHGIFFLIFITLFPRLTLLLATATPFGVFAWLGWFFTPSLLVSIFATRYYWDTNPFLVAVSWLVAVVRTSGEGYATHEQFKS